MPAAATPRPLARSSSFRSRISGVISRLGLRNTWPMWALLATAFVAALLLRFSMRKYFTLDQTVFFGPWFDHLRNWGFSGLATIDSNYNPSFLYLLYGGTLLPGGREFPFDGLYAVKFISGTFDLVGAVGVAFLLYSFRRSALFAAAGGVAYLFVPEIWLNSGLWGQVDSIYTAFLIWALWAVITQRHLLVWVMFALAFSFKLQAAFFLPLFGIALYLQKHRWWKPLVGVGVYFLTLVPIIIAGRPVDRVLGVYLEQATLEQPLQSNAPSIYQWIPETLRPQMTGGGAFFVLGVIAILGLVYLVRPAGWLQMAASFGLVAVFLLPSMHDRYAYAASALVAILTALDRRYLPAAVALQFTAIVAYGPFLGTGDFLIPMPVLAAVQLAAVVWVVNLSLTPRPEISEDRPMPTARKPN